MGRGSKRGSKASAISDRSGKRYPMNEMVVEPGTNYLVHKSETDGKYSLVSHPLSNLGMYLRGKQGDPYPVDNARFDVDWVEPITYETSVYITGTGSLIPFEAEIVYNYVMDGSDPVYDGSDRVIDGYTIV